MKDIEIAVSVEFVVHDAMREIAQNMWDKHRICIKQVSFDWLDVSALLEDRKILRSVDVHTTTEIC